MKASNDDFCLSKATTRDPGYSKKCTAKRLLEITF